MGYSLPNGLGVGRNPPAPQRHGGATRIKEERSLSPSQAMFRNGMYCYFFNLFLSPSLFFFFLLGITPISCYWCVYKLLLLYIFIYIYIFFVFVLLLSSSSFFYFLLNRLFKVRLGWKKFIIPSHSSWMMREKEGSLLCKR